MTLNKKVNKAGAKFWLEGSISAGVKNIKIINNDILIWWSLFKLPRAYPKEKVKII